MGYFSDLKKTFYKSYSLSYSVDQMMRFMLSRSALALFNVFFLWMHTPTHHPFEHHYGSYRCVRQCLRTYAEVAGCSGQILTASNRLWIDVGEMTTIRAALAVPEDLEINSLNFKRVLKTTN
jgi:hypothetical protein